jgi:hypothetical protein
MEIIEKTTEDPGAAHDCIEFPTAFRKTEAHRHTRLGRDGRTRWAQIHMSRSRGSNAILTLMLTMIALDD